MEFLRLFLRRHFAGKPVVVSENVCYRVALYQFCLEIMFLIFLQCFRRLDVVVVEISVIYCHFVV